jgi:hypothetical protein
MADTPLESVPGWSADHVACMGRSWITTAEQVVALAATPRGLRSLAEQLGVPAEEAQRLIEAARAKLAPAVRAEMERVVDPSEYGRGALHPRTEDKDC